MITYNEELGQLKIPLRTFEESNQMKRIDNRTYAYHEMEDFINRPNYDNLSVSIHITRKYIYIKLLHHFTHYFHHRPVFSTLRKNKIIRNICSLQIQQYLYENQSFTFYVDKIDKDDICYYAIIYCKTFKLKPLDKECDVCYELNKNTSIDGYFKCCHKDTICHDCYKKLQNNVCPLCRSS